MQSHVAQTQPTPAETVESASRVLVVDDSAEGRTLTKLVLRRAGFVVDEASSVTEAWSMLKHAPDIVVLDVNLPDGNGLDFARTMRAHMDTMSMPIVHTSGVYTTFRDRAVGLDAGADAYLVDPIDPSLLVATVRALLRMRRAEADAKRSTEREAHLHAVTAALNQAATTSEVTEIVLEEGVRMLHAHCGQVTVHRNASGETSNSSQTTRGTLTSLEQQRIELLDQAVQTGSPVQWVIDADARAVAIAFPLLAHRNVLGTMCFELSSDPKEAQLAYLETLAAQAGNALIRASLYEATLADLRGSEQQLRRLIEYAPDAIVVIDATDMRCIQANPAAADLLGTSIEGLVGSLTQTWSPRYQPGGDISAEKVATAIQEASSGSRPVFEWTFLNASTNSEVGCEVRLLRLPDPHRALVRGSILRVDGHKAAEAADRRAAASAQRALREHDVAVELQQSFLPRQLEVVAGITVHSRYEAASEHLAVGGDWFDSIVLSPTRIAFCVGDVVGHGLGAVTAMGQLRSAVAAFSAENAGPADVINRLERFAKRVVGAEFTTICYAELQLDESMLRYACAGHPPPLVIERNGDVRFLQDGRSAPLGVSLARPRSDATTLLEPGSAILLYSDGLVERRSRPIDIGLAALASAAAAHHDAPPEQFCNRVLTDLTGDFKLSDDVAMLFVRRTDFTS
jgi:serine phosphatase RsbU (regulator of sigma subunit)/DNA-binding response OmpR family regulator